MKKLLFVVVALGLSTAFAKNETKRDVASSGPYLRTVTAPCVPDSSANKMLNEVLGEGMYILKSVVKIEPTSASISTNTCAFYFTTK